MNDKEKTVLAIRSMQELTSTFGDMKNPVDRMIIETLLQELMNAKNLPLSGEPKQEGDQSDSNPAHGTLGQFPAGYPGRIEPPTNLEYPN